MDPATWALLISAIGSGISAYAGSRNQNNNPNAQMGSFAGKGLTDPVSMLLSFIDKANGQYSNVEEMLAQPTTLRAGYAQNLPWRNRSGAAIFAALRLEYADRFISKPRFGGRPRK